MLQPLRAAWLGVLPLLAVTSAFAQSLPTDGSPQLRQLPAATTAALRQQLLDGRQLLRQELGLRPADDLRALRTETDDLGQAHERFQQYYNGVKVEHGVYTLHRAAGLLSGELKPVPAGLSTKPALSAAAALQRATATIGASRYMWQDAGAEAELKRVTGNISATYQPAGELVVVEDYRAPAASRPLVLAWKFNIYAQQPESRAWVYVDARTGEVVLQDAIIKHAKGLVPDAATYSAKTTVARPASPRGVTTAATGTFATRYVGTRQVATDLFNGTYRLRDYTRAAGIETYNLRTSTSLTAGIDFTDNDNNWTAAEFNNTAKDNAALDAHFGSTVVYDYWMTVHGRNSWDNLGSKLINYVHYRANYDNAGWNGSAMQYGDGGTQFRPLTALDVCAHETGHGVCQATAGLVYLNESGALNEGFSDIWGATIENYVDPTKQTWIVGEDVTLNSAGLRSMSNPLSTAVSSICPANYRGQRWAFGTADNGGVHTNSGVLNHWYYILSVGKTGVNEQQQAYSVTGIGIASAARIAYRAERLYLTANSDYRSARMFTIQAATDLFGATSPEVTAVTDAWYAVGLGNSASAPAGAVAQCQTDDAPAVTAIASSTTLCAGDPLTLTAATLFPATRRLRNAAALALPDGATAYSALSLYSNAISQQHGLETIYNNSAGFTGVRVRISHDQPSQMALRLAVRGAGTGNVLTYINLATALPTYTGTGMAVIDVTFSDNATATLPTTFSTSPLTGTFRPATALSTVGSGVLALLNVEARDGQVGSAGTVEVAELLFNRVAADVPSVRWVGPGVDAAGTVVTAAPTAPAGGGVATYKYTALASDPYFGCTATADVTVTVRQPRLAAAALQTDLCAQRGQAFGPIDLRVTQDDSIATQTYLWTGPSGYAATGKNRRVTPTVAGRLRYTVRTTTPGFGCTNQQTVTVLARRPVAAAPANADSVACVGGTARLRARLLENQLAGPDQFAGSTQIPDNNQTGVRIPLVVAGTNEGFFNLRGIRVSITHTYIGDLELYVEAPDGTRIALSKMQGDAGQNYQNTLFVDSVGARSLNSGAAPYTGAWQVDEPTGFAKLNNAPQNGTWNLWVRDLGPTDIGSVTAWAIVTKDNAVTWSGPNGFTATGANVNSSAFTVPGRYQFIGTTSAGGCSFRDTVRVRVAPGPEWRLRQSTDLALAANWTCLPTPTTDANVLGTGNGQPILTTGLVQVRNLTLRAGTTLALNGGTLEIYGTLTVEPGATITGTNGTLSLRGAAVVLNAPTRTALTVPRLLVNLPAAADTARLGQTLTVITALTMQRGILKTQAAEVALVLQATITETADAYVSGQVTATGFLNNGTSETFGGVGLTLTQGQTSPGGAGTIQLTRITDRAIGQALARTGIRRSYTLSYSAPGTASATVRQYYRDAELNGLPEADLQPYRASSTGVWTPIVRTGQNAGLNYVEGTDQIAGTWTLSTPVAMLPVRSSAASGFVVQAQPVPFGAAGFSLTLQAVQAQPAAEVAVYDLAGRLVFRRSLNVPAGLSAVALPEAGHLAAGVYLVRATLGGETQTLRLSRE